MVVLGTVWVALVAYALANNRSEPPTWWMTIAAGNILATIGLGIAELF